MMAEKYLVGIIQVPLDAFTTEVGVGREEDPRIIKKLSTLFRRTTCRPGRWENHVIGLIDDQTLANIMSVLGMSQSKFRDTVRWATYPKAYLQSCILCLDGKQRIAAARKVFGKMSWWTVRLYYVSEGKDPVCFRIEPG